MTHVPEGSAVVKPSEPPRRRNAGMWRPAGRWRLDTRSRISAHHGINAGLVNPPLPSPPAPSAESVPVPFGGRRGRTTNRNTSHAPTADKMHTPHPVRIIATAMW